MSPNYFFFVYLVSLWDKNLSHRGAKSTKYFFLVAFVSLWDKKLSREIKKTKMFI